MVGRDFFLMGFLRFIRYVVFHHLAVELLKKSHLADGRGGKQIEKSVDTDLNALKLVLEAD